MISADVSRIDFCMGYFHISWTAPIQMLICLVLLVYNLGYSAVPGFGFCILMMPVQGRITKVLFSLRLGSTLRTNPQLTKPPNRKRSMVWTVKRIKVLQEVLGGMRIIKYFAWEACLAPIVPSRFLRLGQVPYMKRIAEYRNKEIGYVSRPLFRPKNRSYFTSSFLRTRLVVRALNNAIAFSLPVLSSVVSIVTYAATGHKLDADILFSSLALFTLLRVPLQVLRTSEITRLPPFLPNRGYNQQLSPSTPSRMHKMLSGASRMYSSRTSRTRITRRLIPISPSG